MAHRTVLYDDDEFSIYTRMDEKGVWLCEDYPIDNSHALCFTEQGIVYVGVTPVRRWIEPVETWAECYMFCDSTNRHRKTIKTRWLESYLERNW